MGSCCGTQTSYNKLSLNLQGKTTEIPKKITNFNELQAEARRNYRQLTNKEFTMKINENPLTNDNFFQYTKGKGKLTITIDIENDQAIDLSGGYISIKSDELEHAGFVTNFNLVMTTNKVLPSPEKALQAKSDLQLDPKVFFYRNSALSFSLVGLQAGIRAEPLPILCTKLHPGDKISINNTTVTLISLDPYKLVYKYNAIPGTPILYQGKVVGMHISNNIGVNILGVIEDLKSVSTVHLFSSQINEFLHEVIFEEGIPSSESRFHFIYCPKENGLSSYNIISQEFKNVDIKIPKNSVVAQAETGAYISGGKSDNLVCKKFYFFDSYTFTLFEKHEMITARENHAMAIMSTGVYVISGFNGSELTNECEYFDIKKNVWYPIYPINLPRNGATATVFLENLYVAGGLRPNGSFCENIEKFVNNRWENLKIKAPESLGNIKIFGDGQKMMILGKSLWRSNNEEWETISDEKQELPGKHIAILMNKLYVFVNPRNLLVWGNESEWRNVGRGK
ncbi:unnamed protein product [Blepharisma stoltei]|uniref:Uncharacterized protein n=1 Tax=Blepharisma stoltei TaxID=1481888 RepID=A0AAU9JBA3_9CILI|nr:unnamed protein product [Blepharisma stoltei]